MENKYVYVLIENTKYSNNISVFKTKKAREKLITALKKEYSKEYNIKIENIHDLHDLTFGAVYIDLFDKVLVEN